MKNLQVKNIPPSLHRELCALAKRRGRTLREVVLRAVEREVAQDRFRRRLAERTPVRLDLGVAGALEEARKERERELEP